MFDLDDVPRNPSDATDYLLKFLLARKSEWYGRIESKKTQTETLDEIIAVFRAAVERLQIDEKTKLYLLAQVRAHGKTRDFVAGITSAQRKLRVTQIHQHFDGTTKDSIFNLDKEAVARIMRLIAEMKDIVTSSDIFSKDHKKRLIDRISQVEIEIHKEKGRFDVILGGVVDFGDALGLFGKKVKPLVDRMKEIRNITQKTTRDYQRLPPPDDLKRLPPPDSDAGE